MIEGCPNMCQPLLSYVLGAALDCLKETFLNSQREELGLAYELCEMLNRIQALISGITHTMEKSPSPDTLDGLPKLSRVDICNVD